MKSKLKSATELITKDLGNIYKILDKLEQRISSLEKVLESHAKCIGELRGTELRIHNLKENFIPIRKNQIESIEKELKNES